MSNCLDDVILDYLRSRSEATLISLNVAFVKAKLFVPVAESLTRLDPGAYDVAIRCVKTESGTGAIPVFTTIEHLYEWKPAGCKYAVLTGGQLIGMASGMGQVAEILVNLNGVPRGRIPREDFDGMMGL